MINTLKKTNTCTNTCLTMYDRNTHANCKSLVQLIMQPWLVFISIFLYCPFCLSSTFKQDLSGLGSFLRMTQPSFLKGLCPVILSVLGCCSSPLTLTMGHGSNQEKPSRTSCALNNLFYLNCEEAIWINHPS